MNERADYLSKIVDYEDWKVKDEYFHATVSRWGLCTIDCFANCDNAKTPRYYSKFYYPNSLGVDAFAFSWSGEFCWLVPPVSLIPRAIKHVCLSQCRAVLVVPVWPSAVFWPFLINSDGSFRSIITDMLYFEDGKHCFEHGANRHSLFGSSAFNSPAAFMLLDGALG